MSAKYEMRYLDASEYARWDQFVDQSPSGSVYSLSTFLKLLCAAAGTQFEILTLWKGDEIVAGLGVHFFDSRFGRHVHPRGLLYYNGFVLRECTTHYPSRAASQQMHLMDPLIAELEGAGYADVTLAHRSPLVDMRLFYWHSWDVQTQYTYLVPIGDLGQLWGRIDQNLRRLIKRCEKQGLHFDVLDDFDLFYRLHVETYARRNLDPYFSPEDFRNFYEGLTQAGLCQMYAAWMPEGDVAAVQLVLRSEHPISHTWSAAADHRYLQSGASAFLRWKVFEDQHAHGVKHNDLTDAMQPSVARFKSQLGANLVPYYVA